MVKLKGPGLSAAAVGSLGRTITFSSSKGRAYLKKKPTPAQPRSGEQVSMRAMMTFLSQQWQNLLNSYKVTWANAYPDPELNNYNAYLRHNLSRWRSRRPPSKAYPATETGTPTASAALNATGAVRHVSIAMGAGVALLDNWTILLFHSTVASPDPDFDKLIYISHREAPGGDIYTHSPLPTGTHYYRIIPTTDDGNVDWTKTDTDSAIVT